MTFHPQNRPYSSFENNTGPTDRRTDGQTDGHDLLQRCVVASKNRHMKSIFLSKSVFDGILGKEKRHKIDEWCFIMRHFVILTFLPLGQFLIFSWLNPVPNCQSVFEWPNLIRRPRVIFVWLKSNRSWSTAQKSDRRRRRRCCCCRRCHRKGSNGAMG